MNFSNKQKSNFFADEDGMSIVELIVATSILVLLMGVLSLIMLRAFYINRFTIEQGMNVAEVQKTIRSFTAKLREAKQSDAGGYLIGLAADDELTFFADIDDDAAIERLHYYVDSHKLMLGVSESSGFPASYPANDDSVRIVGNGVVNTASQPLFQYYNREYPTDTVNNPLATPVDPVSIGMVKIDLYINVNTTKVPDSTHMETFVRPRNIKDE